MDEEILAALRRGDTDAAFDLLVRAHGRAVRACCCRILRDPAAAEDMMQDTLISAFESPDRLLEVTNLRGWLTRIAANKCIDELRRSRPVQKRQHNRGGNDAASLDPNQVSMPSAVPRNARSGDDDPALAPDLLAQLVATQEKGALKECLDALDPVTSEAVLMRFRDELSWEEISEILDLPQDTIRMRARRSLKSLRACLTSKGIEP